MDAMPWIDAVKRTRTLRLFAGDLEGGWARLVRYAVGEFNRLSEQYGMGVTLERVSQGSFRSSGAEVEVVVASGDVTFEHGGTNYASTFEGSRMHGLTLLASRDGKIERAKVHLPTQPLVNTPRGRRAVGDAVKKVIVLHEFIHLCGLTNDQHSAEGLFQASPIVDPGDTASQDRARSSGRYPPHYMPPFTIAADTTATVTRLWQ